MAKATNAGAGHGNGWIIAFVLRQVPETPGRSPGARRRQGLPGRTRVRAVAERHGAQASIFGVLGLLAAAEERLEVSVLGLTFGLDPSDLALKLPLVGSIGFDAWDMPKSQ